MRYFESLAYPQLGITVYFGPDRKVVRHNDGTIYDQNFGQVIKSCPDGTVYFFEEDWFEKGKFKKRQLQSPYAEMYNKYAISFITKITTMTRPKVIKLEMLTALQDIVDKFNHLFPKTGTKRLVKFFQSLTPIQLGYMGISKKFVNIVLEAAKKQKR